MDNAQKVGHGHKLTDTRFLQLITVSLFQVFQWFMEQCLGMSCD